MKVMKASEAHRSIIYEHWKQYFMQDPRNIDSYFEHFYNGEQSYVLLDEQQAIASCQVAPHQMVLHGKTIDTSILHSFYTIEERRYQGYLEYLLNRVLMERENLELITLVHQRDFDLNQFRFEPVFFHQVCNIKRNMIPITDSSGVRLNIANADLLELYQYYTKYFNGYFVRNEAYYEQMKQHLRAIDGRYIGVYDAQGELRASVRMSSKSQEAMIDEIVYKDTASILKLLSFVLSQYSSLQLHMSLVEDIKKIVPEALVSKQVHLYARLNHSSLFERLYNVKVRTSDSAINAFQKPLFNSDSY